MLPLSLMLLLMLLMLPHHPCSRRIGDRAAGSHLRCCWNLSLGFRHLGCAEGAGVAAFSAALGRIFDFGVCMALIRMPEPRGSLLFATHERNPLIAASAKSFPNVWIPIHSSRFLWFLEWTAGRCTDAVGETLVVPESAVFENEPTTRLADSAPTFALVPVTAHPTRSVQVAVETEFLLVRDEIRVARVHVLGWWRDLLFVEGGVEVWWIA